MAISVSPKTGIGDRLKEARLRRGVDLQEVSRVTRIKPRLLEALEREAPPRTFGAPVYARAFLRTYARYLGLPAEPMVEEYRAAHGEPDATPMRLPVPVRSQRRRSIGHVVLALVTVAALAALVWVSILGSGERTAPAPEPPPTTMQEPRDAPPPGTATAEEIRLRVRLVDGASWMRVVVDGERVVQGRRNRGFNRLFRAERRIHVEIDDAGAARLTLGGRRLGAPGPSGVSYRASYTLRDGKVRTVDGS